MNIQISEVANLPSRFGAFKVQAFQEPCTDGGCKEHLAIFKENIAADNVLDDMPTGKLEKGLELSPESWTAPDKPGKSKRIDLLCPRVLSCVVNFTFSNIFSRTNGRISTKLGTKHPYGKPLQVCEGKGRGPHRGARRGQKG